MRWPWREKRQDSSYTDTLVALFVEANSDKTLAIPGATGALESCAGLVARAFASAEVKAPPAYAAALGPSVLSLVGRALIRGGEFVAAIDMDNGRLALTPASSWNLYGGALPSTWRYRLTLNGPDVTSETREALGSDVVHVRYAADVQRPWKGISPLESASIAGRLSAETSQALADEASGPRGSFLPIPADGKDTTVATMKGDVRKARGAMLFAEAGDWDNAGGDRGADYKAQRFGADPPSGLVSLLEAARLEVFGAVGLSPVLFDARGDGTARREAFRQSLHSCIAPLGRLVETELSEKMETDVRLDFSALFAADLSGRARAFQSLVGGGMDVAKAAGLAGLLQADE